MGYESSVPRFCAINRRLEQTLARRVWRADRFGTRLWGLLGKRALSPHEGLHLVPCSAIHTFFMGFAIDAVFLDAEGRVVKLFPALPPWSWAQMAGAHSVLELPAGRIQSSGTDVGDAIAFHQV